jgi:hypothetical protein
VRTGAADVDDRADASLHLPIRAHDISAFSELSAAKVIDTAAEPLLRLNSIDTFAVQGKTNGRS